MNTLQRAWRSLFRHPVRSCLLVLITSIISVFLIAAMAGKEANMQMQDKTRQALGAGLRLDRKSVV